MYMTNTRPEPFPEEFSSYRGNIHEMLGTGSTVCLESVEKQRVSESSVVAIAGCRKEVIGEEVGVAKQKAGMLCQLRIDREVNFIPHTTA